MAENNHSTGKSSDLTFITNEAGQSLRARFAILLGKDTRFFDCLVGYFFISGFYKLYSALENVEKIRILVGLSTDRAVYEHLHQAKEKGELALRSHASVKERLGKDVLNELEKSADSMEIEAGVHKFVEWIRSGKLEIKAYPSQDLHAKVYVMTFVAGHIDAGRVITGSSNFTRAGLQDNLEFNVELKNRSDYEFALRKFNELWARAVDLSKPYEDTIVNKSQFANFTPYELYLKFLYEYFRNELNRPSELEDVYVPPGFKKLKYQEEAVLNARRVLDEYGGVFLSDVVGLGKTYMAALLAQQINKPCIVIAPPHLLDEDNPGSWPNIFRLFGVRGFLAASAGNLETLVDRDLNRYEYVFVDESHRFRAEDTQSYDLLAQICRGKKVVLVSATPLNNTPRDILSQVKLFQAGKAGNIPNMRNLEAFFAGLEAKLKGLDRQADRDLYFKTVQANAKETREKILKFLMVRRTRTEIETYYGEDMQRQELKFPEVKDPVSLFYKFSKQENEVFDETLKLLTAEFTYARYTPLLYYTGKMDERERQGQRNLAKFMKILMVKRLESSFHAFRLTLDRFMHSYTRVIAEFKKGNVYISKKHIGKIFDLLEEDDQEGIESLLEQDKAERLDAADFTAEFIRNLESDCHTLERIGKMWANVRRDPKWLAFREVLKSEEHLRKDKIIIFTESQETAEYLAEKIRGEVEPKTLLFSGKSGEAERRNVIASFDANAFKPADDYRILVSTEVLSEGVNLHRSNVVVNYDIPWNPTRLIQRVGRVNRIDTHFDAIYTYNFFPTEESNDAIKLQEAAEAKIHAFIEMLGVDARLLTDGEEIKSFDLFARINSKKTITGEDEEEESELEYLAEIRNVRDKQPELFARIKHLPKKARSTRELPAARDAVVRHFPSLLTYFRRGRLDMFYLVAQGPAAPVKLDFLDAVKVLKPADAGEKRKTIPADFYVMLDKNKEAFAAATGTENDDLVAHHKRGAGDAYILRRLKAQEIRNYHGFTEDDEAYIRKVIQLLLDGALPKPTAKKAAEALKKENDPLKALGILRRDIPAAFFQPTHAQQMDNANMQREVIISSWVTQHE